jgi:predicted DNA binding protein
MRKITIELEPNEMVRGMFTETFEHIHSYEVLESLRIDKEEAICVDLIECVLKEDRRIEDMTTIGHMEVLNLLSSHGNKHIMLVKQAPEGAEALFEEFDLDLIHTTPTIITAEKHIYTFIADHATINKVVELLNSLAGNVVSMTFKKGIYAKEDLLSVLTDKQRDILITANKFGYYEYPRRINSTRLSEKVDISKPTLVQHLRKAEVRLMEEIMAGYM